MVIRESATKKFYISFYEDDDEKSNCCSVNIDAGNLKVVFRKVPQELARDTDMLKKSISDRLIELAKFVKG